jgi:thioredoxin-dependent peroxiredoxin
MASKTASDFALSATGGKEFRLSAVKSKRVVLYFYPKDNTPGCTVKVPGHAQEVLDFVKTA